MLRAIAIINDDVDIVHGSVITQPEIIDQGALEEDKIETIRYILIADRKLVCVINRMAPLHEHIVRFLSSNNHAILHEYNLIRRKILNVVREIYRQAKLNTRSGISERWRKKEKTEGLDVITCGRVNRLVHNGQIINEMATSLMNDSDEARKIAHDLVDIATQPYYPGDKLMDQIEEKELTQKTSLYS